VSRADLIEAVWGKVAMSESVLRTHLWELRRVLGENVIETVVGRGYRFVADVEDGGRSSRPADSANLVAGRTIEMGILRKAFHDAQIGRRSVVFVSGEPGVGKSTLVDAFVDDAGAQSGVWTARCVCLERCGDVEPFQPLLEALGTMCRGSSGSSALDVLTLHAPTVVAQMPALLEGRREDELRRRLAGAAPARMLRELIEGLEALSNESPLVLAIDDLEWADPATIDLIASLGRRREPSRLLIVATVRSAALARAHRLTRLIAELVAHRRGVSIALAGFDEQAIAEYMTARFKMHRFPAALARTLHSMTGGNPLFIASLFDDLEKDGLNENVEDIEARCQGLVRDRLLVAARAEGDGIAHDQFAFAHGLVRHAAAARSEWSGEPTHSGVLGGSEPREEESNEKLVVDECPDQSRTITALRPREHRSVRASAVPDDPRLMRIV
jgi:hypothetical protein